MKRDKALWGGCLVSFLCLYARCKLAQLALHLMFATYTGRGRLSSPEAPR